MTFLAPHWLWLLAAVAALVALFVLAQLRRKHYAVRFTNVDLLASLAPRRPGWRRHVAAALAGLGIVSLVLALARPMRDERVPRDAATVMLVVDVSASMMATDIEPSRLEAAKVAAAGFVEDVPEGFRLGLVAFDSNARLLQSPTTDHASVVAAIQRLAPGTGTATGDGIRLALETLRNTLTQLGLPATPENGPAGTVVLLSDGATTTGTPLPVATGEAAQQGVPVTTIAYGTDSGTVVVQGELIPVPADEEAMRSVAEATGGSFFTAGSAGELNDVYDDIQSRIGYTTEQREVLRWFVGLAVLLLLAATGASLLWSARFL